MVNNRKNCDCDVFVKVKALVDSGAYPVLIDIAREWKDYTTRVETVEQAVKTMTELSADMKKNSDLFKSILCGVGEFPGIDRTVKEHDVFFQRVKPIFWIMTILISLFGAAGIWNFIQILLKK